METSDTLGNVLSAKHNNLKKELIASAFLIKLISIVRISSTIKICEIIKLLLFLIPLIFHKAPSFF
jgi:hypothetical protein